MKRNRMTWMAATLGVVAVTGTVGCRNGSGSSGAGKGAANISAKVKALADVKNVTLQVSSASTGNNVTVPLVGSGNPPSQYSAVVSDLQTACDYVFTATAQNAGGTTIYSGTTGTPGTQCINKNQTANIVIDMADQTAKQTVNDEAPWIDALSETAGCAAVNDTVTIKATMHDIDTGDTAGMTWTWGVATACGALSNQVDTAGTDTVAATSQVTFKALANSPGCQVTLIVKDARMASTLQTQAALSVVIGDACAYGNAKITAIPDTCPAITGVTTNASPLVNGQPATLSVIATDSDNDPLNYHWTSDCATPALGHFVNANADGSATGNPVQFVYGGAGNLPTGVDCNFFVTVDDGAWTSGNLQGQTKCSVVANMSVPGTAAGYQASSGCKWGYDYMSSNSVGDGDQVTLEINAPCASPVWSAGTAIPAADLTVPFTTGVTFTTPTGSVNTGASVTVTCGTGATACTHSFAMIGKNAFCATANEGDDCTTSAQLTNKCIQSAKCAAGACVAQTNKSCPANANVCLANVCTPTTGNCDPQPANQGGACTDGLACNGTSDKCNGGLCQPTGAPVSCSGSTTCAPQVCSETSTPAGQCVASNALQGTECNDGQSCTTGDVCNGSGTCAGTAVTCSVGFACLEPAGPTCSKVVCDRPAFAQDVAPFFYGLGADGAGNGWGAGVLTGSFDFGTGTALTAASSDAFLVKYNSDGTTAQAWDFGEFPAPVPAHDQTAAGLAVAHDGAVAVIGTFNIEVDFTQAGANGNFGKDFLASSGAQSYYAVISGSSSGVDPTVTFAHMAALGTGGALLAVGSNPTQNAFAICGKANGAMPVFNSTSTSSSGTTAKGIMLPAAGTAGGSQDIVVAKVDSATGFVLWGKQFGGTGNQICNSVALDSNGDVVLTGTNDGVLNFGAPTSSMTAPSGAVQLFVARLKSSDGTPIVAQSWGSAGTVVPKVAVDKNNNIAVVGGMRNVGAGITFSASVNAPYAANVTANGAYDMFAVRMDTNLVPSCAFADGDVANDQLLNAVDFNSAGQIVATGGFIGNLPGLSLTNTSITAQDVVELTLDTSCAAKCVKQYGSAAGSQQGNLVSVANASSVPSALMDSIWTAGSYTDTIDFDTLPADTIINSGSTSNIHNYITRQK